MLQEAAEDELLDGVAEVALYHGQVSRTRGATDCAALSKEARFDGLLSLLFITSFLHVHSHMLFAIAACVTLYIF